MRITAGDTGRSIYLVAVDDIDYITRKTGLDSWTVYFSIDGGDATEIASPSISEVDSTYMPGVYQLALDIPDAVSLPEEAESGELVLHISHDGIIPITRVITIERSTPALILASQVGFSGSSDVSVAEALRAAWVQGRGAWDLTTEGYITLYEPDGITPLVVLELDNAKVPKRRTPVE